MTADGNRPSAAVDAGPRTNGRITGLVYGTAPDSPLPGAALRAVGPRGTVLAYALTGDDGRFQLPGLPHGLSPAPTDEAPRSPRGVQARPDGAALHLKLDGTRS